MKILHVLASIEFSGAEKMLVVAAEKFKERNYELHALSTSNDENNPGSYTSILNNAGYHVHHIPWKDYSAWNQFYKLIKREKFDAIHLHAEQQFFQQATIARLATNKPIVRTVHNVFDIKGLAKYKRQAYRYLSDSLMKVSFVSIGPSVEQHEQEYFKLNTTRVDNWIDEKKYKPAKSEEEVAAARKEFNIEQNEFVFVSVGACTPVKNQKDILLALKEIKKANLIENVRYILLGDGPLKEDLQKDVVSSGLEKNVTFTGNVANVRDYLIASDVFLMPSRFEGLSIAMLEAQCCAKPVIGYSVVGVKDLIEDNYNGFLINPDPKELEEKMIFFIKNKEKSKVFGENARSLFCKNYNINTSTKKLHSLYAS